MTGLTTKELEQAVTVISRVVTMKDTGGNPIKHYPDALVDKDKKTCTKC